MKNQVLPVFAAWLVFALAALMLGHVALDTDSAMRLADVRDLLHGQNWFDTSQHRMNTPYGLPMHWSRLVDAPLALLILVSESFALMAWPLTLFAGVLFALARIAAALGGRRAMMAVLGLALLGSAIWAPFMPGDIDHHGLQLLLMLLTLVGLVERRAILSAAAATLGLGVGLEVLPYAALACLAAALWLRDEVVLARRFGLALAGMALLMLFGTTASAYRFTPACDTYSLFYAVLLVAGGAGVAAISYLPRHRLIGLAVLAATLLALAALVNPGCFAGPYAGMDARLKAIFLERINEARPLWEFWRMAPGEVIGGFAYACVALMVGFAAPPSRGRNVLAGFAALALAVAVFQFRAVPFAVVFALPLLAAALAFRVRGPALIAAIAVCSSAAFMLVASLGEGDGAQARARRFAAQVACGGEAAMAPLKALPPGRAAAFVDQGPAVLAYTLDSVIAGPYHRDAAGILDSYEIFAGSNPRAVLARRGINYLMTCRAAPDWEFYRAKGGLIAQIVAGRTPDWLAKAGQNGDVTVYKIR
jgi:hypothetical protein